MFARSHLNIGCPQGLKPTFIGRFRWHGSKACPSQTIYETANNYSALWEAKCKWNSRLRRGLEVAVGQVASVAVAVQPVVKEGLVEVRGDDFFSQLVRVGADERQAKPGEHSDQRLGDAVGIGCAVGVFGLDLGQR